MATTKIARLSIAQISIDDPHSEDHPSSSDPMAAVLSRLFVSDFHLVHKNAVGSWDLIAVQLESVGELVVIASIEGVVADIHGRANPVDGKRVMEDRVRRRITMVFRQNVVPAPWREAL